MASFAAVGVSRVSFLKATCLDFNGCRSCCSLPPSSELSSTYWTAGLKSTGRRRIVCSAVQESSAPTVSAETKEAKPVEKEAPPPKPKPAAKAPVKPLPAMMEEDVLPALRSIIEAQEDISDLELSFQNNRLDGSFKKKNYPYSFWAFFPSGAVTGPKGFSLSSYGSEASTVEPFLIDEKKITARHIVFWVEKRLAAQGIIPVWNEE